MFLNSSREPAPTGGEPKGQRKRRVMITGCGGMLGRSLYPYLAERSVAIHASDRVASAPWLKTLDICDRDAVARAAADFRPDVLINLAAETDLEYCETHPEEAHRTNAVGAEHVARIADELGAIHVYISTAGVFDGGKEGFYTEDDAPNPIMVYGATKFEGEERVRAACPRHYIVRAGWMVGGGPGSDHKFVSKILDQLIAGRTVIHAVDDKWGTPTYTYDFARNLDRLLDRDAFGTYHMVCEGAGTRYDVAREIVAIAGRPHVEVRPVGSDFFADEYFAPRPRSEMMTNSRLRRINLNLMRPWQDALRDYITNHYAMVLA